MKHLRIRASVLGSERRNTIDAMLDYKCYTVCKTGWLLLSTFIAIHNHTHTRCYRTRAVKNASLKQHRIKPRHCLDV